MSNTSMHNLPVIIAGAGLAGTVTAILLSRKGLPVKLIDRFETFDKDTSQSFGRVETLPGAGVRLLRASNLAHLLDDGAHCPSAGTMSAWGNSPPKIHDSICDPYGQSWLIDRSRLHQQLIEEAAAHGVAIQPIKRIDQVQSTDRGAEVLVQLRSVARRIEGRLIVDATGKSAVIGRRLGAYRQIDEKLAGIEAIFTGRKISSRQSDLAQIESTGNGWWYAANHPAGHLYLLFVSFTNFVGFTESMTASGLLKAAQRTKYIWQRLRGVDTSHVNTRIRTVALISGRLSRVAGPSWVAIGDASISFDPVASRGMFHCLYTATKAALLATQKSSPAEAYKEYSADIYRIWQAYCEQRIAVYQVVSSESLFWKPNRLREAQQ